MVIVYCAKNYFTEGLNVCTLFISHSNPTSYYAADLYECILKFMGIDTVDVESVHGVSGTYACSDWW